MSAAPDWLWGVVAPFALAVARLAPITFLCPLLGGATAPGVVRLGVALSLAAFVSRLSPNLDSARSLSLGGFIISLALEAFVGLAMGLTASAPFDAARVSGRLMDLARGSSAEAALPHSGTREAASGDLLYQLLVALAASSPLFALMVGAMCRSFAAVPVGSATAALVDLNEVLRVTGSVVATGLAIAAPAITACLVVDFTVGLLARVGPAFGLQDQVAGFRLVVGAVAFWIGLGATADALLQTVGQGTQQLALGGSP